MKSKVLILLLTILTGDISIVQACKWDSTTLSEEKKRHPELAKVVLGEVPAPEDPKVMRERIQKLMANRRENEPMWWNDLAVAHMNLGELKESVLESVTNRFANDYGIHANLGTAYHLMGRYTDAEKEIARDLEINPDAHFGLEKYHLALLQYLVRDDAYKSRHVYVDEFTVPFFNSSEAVLPRPQAGMGVFEEPNKDGQEMMKLEKEYAEVVKKGGRAYGLGSILVLLTEFDSPPDYRKKWNLAVISSCRRGLFTWRLSIPRSRRVSRCLGFYACGKGIVT
ncbi:tetratricopeptide repeat protein [Pedosphaera parvula]|uniref:Uncharacterized protein n=1 Tax=Pedosphaera parvula (strain Ellin514) TaxID=320771 RepID=B9XQ14_PEDPL|nr:tetratricopeptide repeat protein [Pedosphaera parvula]EEF58111.1 hypothetical protein Cflav_PD1350 [Pedosphaera parvula Ellin514]